MIPKKTGKIEVVIAGAPNTGKTTVFNKLTGFSSRVSNYAGVTVESKVAVANFSGISATVTDLPGIYSISTHSDEEIVTRRALLEKSDAIVVCVLDATQLERNLFLAAQLIELGLNVVIALNKIDRLRETSNRIDTEELGRLLNVSVVPICARNNEGISELKKVIVNSTNREAKPISIDYGEIVNPSLAEIETLICESSPPLATARCIKMYSIGLLVGDSDVQHILKDNPAKGRISEAIARTRGALLLTKSEELQNYIDEHRYRYINGFINRILKRTDTSKVNASDRLDRWLMSPAIGIPVFMGVMWLMFTIVFVAAAPLSDLLDGTLAAISDMLRGKLGSGSFESLVLDGVIGGVGAVIIFVPSIFLLFAGLALLEDTGYLSRAAFIMEQVMSRFGLPGKAFMPIMLGFGCNVPAIMATRILEDKRDRTITILVIPFISCSARLPVYILLAGALCPANFAGTAVFAVYLLSVGTALGASAVLRKLMFKGASSQMILEIPPYSVPTIKNVTMHAWRNSLQYIQKAFTFILAGSIILWVTLNFPVTLTQADIDKQVEELTERYVQLYQSYPSALHAAEEGRLDEVIDSAIAQARKINVEGSMAGRIGKFIEPALMPLGFDWRIGVGLLGGILAKEIVNSTLGVIFSSHSDANDSSIVKAIRHTKKPDGTPLYTSLTAISLMVFVLLYIPCVATLAVQKKELGNNTKAFTFALTYTTVVAYIFSLIVYQGGKLLGIA